MPEINSSTTLIKFVTIDELASIFGVSRSTVKNWRARRIIKPCVAIGGVVRFDPAECKRKLAEFGGKNLKSEIEKGRNKEAQSILLNSYHKSNIVL